MKNERFWEDSLRLTMVSAALAPAAIYAIDIAARPEIVLAQKETTSEIPQVEPYPFGGAELKDMWPSRLKELDEKVTNNTASPEETIEYNCRAVGFLVSQGAIPVETDLSPYLPATATVKAASLNVRSGPSVDNPRIAGLEKDVKVPVIGRFQLADGSIWYLVVFKDSQEPAAKTDWTSGWVSGGEDYSKGDEYVNLAPALTQEEISVPVTEPQATPPAATEPAPAAPQTVEPTEENLSGIRQPDISQIQLPPELDKIPPYLDDLDPRDTSQFPDTGGLWQQGSTEFHTQEADGISYAGRLEKVLGIDTNGQLHVVISYYSDNSQHEIILPTGIMPTIFETIQIMQRGKEVLITSRPEEVYAALVAKPNLFDSGDPIVLSIINKSPSYKPMPQIRVTALRPSSQNW